MTSLLKFPRFTRPATWLLAPLVGLTIAGCGGGQDGAGETNSPIVGTPELPATTTPTAPTPVPQPAPDIPLLPSQSANTLNFLSQINATTLEGGDLIDNFSTQAAVDGSRVSGWVFSNGAEFKGAQGDLVLTTSSGRRHAELQGDLGCGTTSVIVTPTSGCGKYVAAIKYLSTPIDVASPNTARVQLRFRLDEPMMSVGLRLIDSSGQTLQYSAPAHTLESVAGNTWTQIALPVKQPSNFWGGVQTGQLQGPVKQMSMLLTQKDLVGPRGALKIDDMRLLRSNTTALALSGREPVLSNGVIPTLNGRMAVAARYYKISDAGLRQASEAGFSVVRVDLFWDTVERNGAFNFGIYDTVLNRLAAHGMKALFILNYGHPDHGRGAPVNPHDREAFLEYARQAAQFAKGRNVVGFEVWNEPDNKQFWSDASPQTYAQLLEPTRAAVKAVDPSRIVMNGGTSWVNLPYILALAKTGKLAKLDAFAIHPYRKKTNPETFATDLASLRFMLKSQGVQAPVWATEWGYSSGGLNGDSFGNGHDTRARVWQARMVLRSQLTQIALNLPLMTTYELVDTGTDPDNPEHNYGLLNSSLDSKPAHTALKQLYSLIKNVAYEGLVRDVPPNVHAMRWKDNNKTVHAVWLDTDGLTATITVPANAQVLNWDGSLRATSTSAQQTRYFTLTQDGGPVYVVF